MWADINIRSQTPSVLFGSGLVISSILPWAWDYLPMMGLKFNHVSKVIIAAYLISMYSSWNIFQINHPKSNLFNTCEVGECNISATFLQEQAEQLKFDTEKLNIISWALYVLNFPEGA